MVELKIDRYGDKRWYQYSRIHRTNMPAIIYSNGNKEWCRNDLFHRLDGPAIEYIDNQKYWFYENQHIECNSQEEFERLIKLKLLW